MHACIYRWVCDWVSGVPMWRLIKCFHLSDTRLKCTWTERGKEYNGTLTTTMKGYTCQRWDTDVPQVRYTGYINDMSNFQEATLAEASNYCRQAGGSATRPWCYTTNPSVRWDICNIPSCQTYYST